MRRYPTQGGGPTDDEPSGLPADDNNIGEPTTEFKFNEKYISFVLVGLVGYVLVRIIK